MCNSLWVGPISKWFAPLVLELAVEASYRTLKVLAANWFFPFVYFYFYFLIRPNYFDNVAARFENCRLVELCRPSNQIYGCGSTIFLRSKSPWKLVFVFCVTPVQLIFSWVKA